MGKSSAISLIGLAGWFALKLYGLGTLPWESSITMGVLWHFTTFIALAVFGARAGFQSQEEHFLDRWKSSAQGTARHALLVSVAMGLWYYIIAPGALENQKRSQIEQVQQALGNSSSFESLQAAQPELSHLSREDVLKTQMNNLDVFYSPVFFIGLSLLMWLFVSLFSAALMDLIWQRIWSH